MPFHGGSFLVARPVLQDPNFRQAVVFLLQHAAEGAIGLVVNRPGEAVSERADADQCRDPEGDRNGKKEETPPARPAVSPRHFPKEG